MTSSPLSLPVMAEKHPTFPVPSLRWIRFRSQDPTDETYAPFADAFIKLGGRVLVDEQRFLEIVSSRTGL